MCAGQPVPRDVAEEAGWISRKNCVKYSHILYA
jgi:hypothetical protein